MAGESAHTLKLRGAEPVLPGLALPEAFEGLDRRIEASIKLCKLSTPPDTHVLSVIGICQELQRLLKCSFIENGILASRLEILVKHQEDSLKKTSKRMAAFDIEEKVTRKHLKALRKRVTAHDMYQRKKTEKWWNLNVRTSDYESFSTLSRAAGSPDLEFGLRVNQLLIDFVADQERTDVSRRCSCPGIERGIILQYSTKLSLPPMGQDERAEVSKLASIYKIRCRYGKSTQLASSTLIKARQTCIPGHGEVDAILGGFTKAQQLKRQFGGVEESSAEEVKMEGSSQGEASSAPGGMDEVPVKGKSQSPPVSAIPSTMLTPLSSLTPASIDMSGSSVSLTPVPSPPTSGLSTPSNDHVLVKARRDSYDRSSSKSRSRCGSQSSLNEHPLPVQSVRPATTGSNLSGVSSASLPSSKPASAMGVLGGVPLAGGGIMPTVGSLASLGLPPHARLSVTSPSLRSSHQQSHHSSGLSGSLPQASGPGSLVGSMILQQQQQHHLTTTAVRPLNQPTVVASPLKIPVSQLPHSVQHNLTNWVGGGLAPKEPSRPGDGRAGGRSAEVRGGVTGPRGSSQAGASMEGEEDSKKDGGMGAASASSSESSPQKRTRLSRKAAASSQPSDTAS